MIKFFILLFILGASFECSFCGATRGMQSQPRNSFPGRRNSYIGHDILGTPITLTTTPSTPSTPREYLQANGTFSALTLILVIILITVLALGFYYSVLCYPLIFRTEKNYQFMDVSSTITSATSRSIQSIENFQSGKSLDNFATNEKTNEMFLPSADIIPEKHLTGNFIHQPESHDVVAQKH